MCAMAIVSAGGFGEPCAPLANQAAAGWRTCSFQNLSSRANALKHAVHGSASVYSLGGAPPAAMSKALDRLIFSNFSALALSSACAIKPQALGHWSTNFSMTFSYRRRAAKVTRFNEMHATLNTLQLTSHCCRFCGPGRSFITNEPSPMGRKARNFWFFNTLLPKGNHTEKST